MSSLYLFRIFGRDGEFLLLEGAVGLQIFLHHSELFPISFRYFFCRPDSFSSRALSISDC